MIKLLFNLSILNIQHDAHRAQATFSEEFLPRKNLAQAFALPFLAVIKKLQPRFSRLFFSVTLHNT